MTIRLDHTIVNSKDKREAARFFTEIFGLSDPQPFGPFLIVQVGDLSLDFADFHGSGSPQPQHYAFLVGEAEFDAIFSRVRARGLAYWADPHKQHPNEINHHDGGRGVYWEDPSGHFLEIITVPYGGA